MSNELFCRTLTQTSVYPREVVMLEFHMDAAALVDEIRQRQSDERDHAI